MEILLPLLVSVLFASIQADIEIVSTPDGKTGPDHCVRVCSGVDKNYSGWINSQDNRGKVLKWISMIGCDFVSEPVVTVVSSSGNGSTNLCPSFTVTVVWNKEFLLKSVSDFDRYKMANRQCRVFWTATGFTC